MYKISDKFAIACKKLSRQSRTKIIIDNITYDGANYIKDYPKFSHKSEKMIGGFPIKSAEFSLWTKNGNIDVINKEIKIFKGLVIDNAIEWIPQGVFYASEEDVTTSDSGEYITVKCYDGAKKLGSMTYVDNNVYPISEAEYITNVINSTGFEIDLEFFISSDYVMTSKPNMSENTSIREIVGRYAEQRGAIALFSWAGKIQIKRPTVVDFSYKFYEYKRLTCEQLFGGIDQLILGNEKITNNIVFPQNSQHLFHWQINDNPFLDSLKQERVEEIYNQIKDLSMTPFSLDNALDSFCLDINDVIRVQKKDGTYQNFTILSIETQNRLKCKLSADVQGKTNIDYALAGSVREANKKIALNVDYNNRRIEGIIEKQSEQSSEITKLELNQESINADIKQIKELTKSVTGNKYIEINDAMQGDLLNLSIVGDMSLLLPPFFPSSTTYVTDNYLVIKGEKETKRIKTNINYLNYLNSDVYDEFIIGEEKTKIIRRVGINENGSKYALSNEKVEILEHINIELFDGYNKIYLESFTNNSIKYEMKYVIKNNFTDLFTTNLEMNAKFEMQNQQINLELSKKTDNKEIIASINMSTEKDSDGSSLAISGDKIDLKGKTIDLTADDINIESDKFKVSSDGQVTCEDIDIKSGKLELKDDTKTPAFYMSSILDIGGQSQSISNLKMFGNGMQVEMTSDTYLYAYMHRGIPAIMMNYGNSYTSIFPSGITTPNLTQTSLASTKKNFERLENALSIVKETDIYKYHLKSQNNNEKKHIGFVIGDEYNYSKKITSNNNDGVDTYSMISVAFKAIQEQQAIIEKLEKRVEELEEKLNGKNNI